MSRLHRAYNRLSTTSWRQRFSLGEALVWLALARLALLVVPFRWTARRLGETMAESASDEPVDTEALEGIAWSIRTASASAPWQTKCLAQAIAAKAALRVRGVPSTLYLGVSRPGKAARLNAHAWLRCGDRILTGERSSGEFTVIASFAEISDC